MHSLLDDDALLAGMVRFEVELAAACAAHGLIPTEAARVIAEIGFQPEAATLLREARSAGPLAIPFVRAMRLAVAARDPAAAAALHVGATSQDVLDSALALQIQAASARLVTDALALAETLATLAETHAATVMLGRTLWQGAQPITFGLRAAHWAVLIGDAGRDLRRAARLAAVLQLGGAVGTLAALGPEGPKVAEMLGRSLGLPWPGAPWHARRGDIAALGAALGILVGACGKVARDIAMMMQTGVAEAREPGGGSSAMPHKRNPVAAVAVAACATRAPGLVAGLLAGLPANELERGIGGWQAERPALCELFLLADAAVTDLSRAASALEVDAARMAQNLAEMGGADASEAAVLALSPRLGRATAERRVAQALGQSGDFLAALSEPETAALADPATRTGSAAVFAAALVARSRAGRATDRPITRFVDREGVTLHVRVQGPEMATPIVLVHALGTDLTLWDEVAWRLGHDHRVLRLDLRGHGLSGVARGGFGIDDLADDVLAAMDAAHLHRAVMCGVSVGGLVAQAFALRHPDRLRAAALICTASRIGTSAAWTERISLVRRIGLAEAAPGIVQRWFAPEMQARPGDIQAAERRLSVSPVDGYVAMCDVLARTDLENQVASIRVPVLCVAGREDQAITLDRMTALARAIPGATLTILDGVAHLPPLEAPNRLAGRLAGFVARTAG